MAVDAPPVGAAGESRPTVNDWLTSKARPWAKARWAKAKASMALRSLPGVYAACASSLALGGIVGHWIHGIGPWVTLAATAWWALRLDSRIG